MTTTSRISKLPERVGVPATTPRFPAGYRDRAADWQRLLAETDRAGASC